MPKPPSSPLWQIIDAVAIVFSRAYMLARMRAASCPSPVLRMMARRDHTHWEARMLERELAIFRGQRTHLPPHRRPYYFPEQRADILQIMRLRGWSAKQVAHRFVVHPNTIRSWIKALKNKNRGDRLLGQPPWNKYHEGVRWLVHELRHLCPEREFGARTIARHILRAGIRISRTTVRRILTESPPTKPKRKNPDLDNFITMRATHLMDPKQANRVWQLDLTSVRFLWFHLRIAAIVDGFSRRLVSLKVYRTTPTTDQMIGLLRQAINREDTPRFLITDHGCQFQKTFEDRLSKLGVKLVQGRVGSWRINTKVERVFRTLKLWQRLSLLALSTRSIQRQLNMYRYWYNRHRPHASLGILTPNEAVAGHCLPEAIPIHWRGCVDPSFKVTRENLGSNPHLPVIKIDAVLRPRLAA